MKRKGLLRLKSMSNSSTSLGREIEVQILIKNLNLDDQPKLERKFPVFTQGDEEGVNLTDLVKHAMEYYELDLLFDIQIDYWSNTT